MNVRERFSLRAPALALLMGLAGLMPGTGHAGGGAASAAAIVLADGWVRAVPPVARNSAGYIVIENRGAEDDVLLGAAVTPARVTEIHEMVHDGDSMVMRHRDELAVPAHGRVVLAPGGLHLMLIDLRQPLRVGEKLEAVLRFRSAGEVKVVMDVRMP